MAPRVPVLVLAALLGVALVRISHQLPAATAETHAASALGSAGVLDVLHEYASVRPPSRALNPRGLRRFASEPGEKSGLAPASAPAGRPETPARPPGPRLVWPKPPERARIEHEGILSNQADVTGKRESRGTFRKVVLGQSREMVRPAGVAANGGTLVVVADPGIPTVHFFDLKEKRYARLKPKVSGRLLSPVGVAVDGTGRTYVADSGHGRVFVLDGDHRLAAEWGDGILSRPTGLALDSARGWLYAIDTTACRVFVFDLAGRLVRSFGGRGGGAGELNYPTYAALTPEGDLAVADSLNFRVVIFHPDGTVRRAFGRAGDAAGDFSRPKGIGVDARGRIYVADAAFENIQVFSPDGDLLLVFGGPGTGPGEFTLPAGLSVDAAGRIWVADSFNKRVQYFHLLGDEP